MSLVASHHTRDLTTVEQLSLRSESVGAAVIGPAVHGALVLPTCNRFEVYVEAEDPAAARARIVAELSRSTALDQDTINASLVSFEGDDAVRHLMSVTSGLESMVVGEREISGQVRRAHAEAREAGHLSPGLDKLFQSALRTARVVGSTTGLGTSGRSVMSVAFDLADATVDWDGATAIIVGTGALAETGIGVLRSRGATVVGAHSPSGRGAAFGELYSVPVIDHAGLAEALVDADVVLACSGGESIVLTPTLVGTAAADRDHPLTLIDLALHSDVAPGVESLRGVHVVRLEDVAKHAPTESPDAIESARAIVAHAVARFTDGQTERAIDPAIVALREHVLGLLEQEVARSAAAPDADDEAIARAQQTEQALRRFARALLHTPTVRAKEMAKTGQAQGYLEALNTLYGLEVSMPDDACPAEQIDADLT